MSSTFPTTDAPPAVALIAVPERLSLQLSSRLVDGGQPRVLAPSWPPPLDGRDLILVVAGSPSPGSMAASVRRGTAAPLLLISDAGPGERAQALDLGADVCLESREDNAVIEAHMLAMLRRFTAEPAERGRLTAGTLVVERSGRRVSAGGDEIALSRREFDLLAELMRVPGKARSRHDLLAAVWGPGFVGDSNTVDVHVAWLRQKLPFSAGIRVTTLRGIGYRLDVIA